MRRRSQRLWQGRQCALCRLRPMTSLDLQSLHRVRERGVMRRTAVINQIRGLLLEPSLEIACAIPTYADQPLLRS